MLQLVTFEPGVVSFPDQGLSLQLYRQNPQRRPISRRFGTAISGEPSGGRQDAPLRWTDWSGGGGATQPTDAVENGYGYARNACTRYGHLVMPSGALTEILVTTPTLNATNSPNGITASAEQDGHIYFAAGRYIIRITNQTDPGPLIAADRDFGATIKADSLLEFDGAVWAGTFGAGATLWKLIAGGGGWTNAGTPPSVRKLARVFWETQNVAGVYGGRHELVGTQNATGQKTIIHVPRASDPLVSTNWSAAILIGSGDFPINSLAGSPRHIFCCTSGGVADLDTLGNSPILNPDQSLRRDDVLNGAASLFRDGYIYYSDARGVNRINVSDAPGALHHEDTLCGPGVGLSNETPIFGAAGLGKNPYAFAADSGWVILSVWNGLDSYVCYGRDEGRQDGAGRPIPTWHLGEYWLPGERITHLRITTPGGAGPRLWIGSIDGSGNVRLRWAALPGAASPLQELLGNLDANGNYTGQMRWATAWSIFMTRATWGDDNARKVLLRWDGRSERLTTQTYMRVFAKDDASLAYTQQGSGADPKMDRSPRAELLPIAAGTEQITLGHAIDVRVDGVNTATAPTILRQIQARAEVVAEQRETITYLVELAGPQSMRDGALSVVDPEDIWTQLKRLQTNRPVRMIDEKGNEVLVRVEPGVSKEEDLIRADSPGSYRSVEIAVLTVSIHPTDPSELGLDTSGPVTPTTPGATGVKYGSGRKYGDGITWGATS